jgi:secreted PhoX family phosphatase
MTRYGVGAGGNRWWLADPRFDLAANPNEPNRFGWVVEIDPGDPASTPKKRTALGRLKHENAGFAEAADGRAVVYTGDDERFQYLYKFVSTNAWRRARRGSSPLDDGILYVARLAPDGTGTWLPLVAGGVPGYPTLADILIDTRGAATAVGATPMDRPEWVAPHPHEPGVAYGTFTNNTARATADAPNPRRANAFGHILRWQGTGGDHGALTFTWSMFLLAGKGLGTGDGSTVSPGDAFGSPDGLAFDPDGRLWIQTDGSQPVPCNNQMLAADPVTGDIRRFLVGPRGCEITGWTMTDDQRTMFVNVQHPGEAATDPADPASQSDWPDRKGRPRSATLAIRRHDGGKIGT